MKHKTNKMTIPGEVKDFFTKEGGRSLLVEGEAGTGKTTFALQVLEELGKPQTSFYLSTRVSDEALYTQFPWLREKDMQSRVLDSGKILLESLYKKEKDGDEEKGTSKDEKERLFPYGLTNGVTLECWDFVDACANRRKPEIDAWDGLKAKAISETVYESAAAGKAIAYDDVVACKVEKYQGPINKRWGLVGKGKTPQK